MAANNLPELGVPSPAGGKEEVSSSPATNTITLPRRVVYFQAALLGVIATTFFVFGLMVGSLTSNNGFQPETVSCEVSGKVVYEEDGALLPDAGAVVLMISSTDRPSERLNPSSILPHSFVPLENGVFNTIHKFGGAIVRTDKAGKFNIVVDSPAKYELIVISKNKKGSDSLSKRQLAALSSYFMPIENITANNAVHVSSQKVKSTQKKLADIKL